MLRPNYVPCMVITKCLSMSRLSLLLEPLDLYKNSKACVHMQILTGFLLVSVAL